MFLVMMLSTARGQIIYVDGDAAGPTHDGTSWQNAYQYLQDALADANLAVKPVEIRVAEGTYVPDANSDETGGSGDRAAAFQLIEGVTVKGGYAGYGEPNADARDIELYETILSGDLDGDDVGVIDPCDLLDEPTRAENSYQVVIATLADATAVLDGFTITGGNANGTYPDDYGGGMYNYYSSPTVTDCNFSGNSATSVGGGMCNSDNSSPTVTDCNFTGNSAYAGGGMYNYESSPTVNDCNFSDNSAAAGGGMYNNWSSSPEVTNCAFSGNSTDSAGAGMYNYADSNPAVTNCTFSDNQASLNAGGMRNNYHSSPTVTNCTFSGNIADANGGGMCNWDNSSPTVTNCTFSGNSANFGGGMDNYWYSSPTVTNCTFSGNIADANGGGMYNYDMSSPTVTNCILWCDAAADGNEIAVVDGSTVDVNYCDVKGGEGDVFDDGGSGTVNWGPGNIETDPCFIAPGYWGDVNDTSTPVEPDDPNAVWVDGDYRLLASSPGIDTADNNSVPEDTADLDGDGNTVELIPWDLDGEPRIEDGDGDGNAVVDMGAYELTIPPVPVTMKFMPQALNTCSNGKVKAHFVFPDEYKVEDINTAVPATLSLLGVEVQSEEIKILGAKKKKGPVKVQITFYRTGLCVIETDEDYAEVTVTGYFANGQKYMGTDTIKIITNPQQFMTAMASCWLSSDCGEPNWCEEFDLNHDSVVNFEDFVLQGKCPCCVR
jgi:parallel beta-helix repeat protein